MEVKGFLIDLDGVLTKDEEFNPIPYGVEFINTLKEKGIPFLIATSNSRFTPQQIVQKLQEKGFNISLAEIITPLVVAPDVMAKEGIKTLFIIGSNSLREFFTEKSFVCKDNPDVDGVLVGLDKNLNFQKIKVATTSLKRNGAKLYALNKNIISKDDDGLLFPGVGTVAQMFANACQCNQDFKHFGKMGEEYNRLAFERIGIGDKSKIMMVSDDIYVDLKGYKSLGLKTAFVSTGKYTMEEAKDKDFIDIKVENLKQLMEKVGLS
ncbi:MAG: HAD hydrolase family protein [Aquificae bacterium]|nr:HAD hydrolase family protein [Aquificota bacterium]